MQSRDKKFEFSNQKAAKNAVRESVAKIKKELYEAWEDLEKCQETYNERVLKQDPNTIKSIEYFEEMYGKKIIFPQNEDECELQEGVHEWLAAICELAEKIERLETSEAAEKEAKKIMNHKRKYEENNNNPLGIVDGFAVPHPKNKKRKISPSQPATVSGAGLYAAAQPKSVASSSSSSSSSSSAEAERFIPTLSIKIENSNF